MENDLLELLKNMTDSANKNKVTRLKVEYWIFELNRILESEKND